MALVNAVNFDNLPVGTAPVGWTATRTGTGEAKWTVEKDDTAPSKPNVVKQSGPATYPVCIKDDTSLKDGFVEVKFKPISGREDQAGGLVWRARDSNNFDSSAFRRRSTSFGPQFAQRAFGRLTHMSELRFR